MIVPILNFLPFLAPIAGFLGSAAGATTAGLIGTAASLAGGAAANKASQAASSRQMAFQERMSNTEYQRSMEDMRAAGLNPMLAYQKGGASTPTGSMPQVRNVAEGVPASIQSAVALRRSVAEIKNLNAQTDLTNEKGNPERVNQQLAIANTGLSGANTALAKGKAELTHNQTRVSYYEAEKMMEEAGIKHHELTVAQRDATIAQLQENVYNSDYGQTLIWLKEIAGLPNPIKYIRLNPFKKR